MEKTRLGNSDLYVSRLGLGGCPFGGHGWGKVSDDNSIGAVRAALDMGINFFDTADVYGLGHSEKILSHALGNERHEVVIATKFGVRCDEQKNTVKDISIKHLRKSLEASLLRLRLDCIPLYYVHWPDGKTPVEEAIGELEKFRRQGKIRAIGVSNFSADQTRLAREIAPIACLQVQLSLLDRSALSLEPVLHQTEASLVTWGSLAQGLLSGKYDAHSRFGIDDRRHLYENFQGEKLVHNLQTVDLVKKIATHLGKTPAQIAIRWLLDTPPVSCVLFGAKTREQVLDNTGSVDWSLTENDYWQLLNSQLAISA